MSELLFLRRSYEYHHAAAAALRDARALPVGPERTKARELARGLIDLAKSEAWLEGQRPRMRRMPSESPQRRAAVATAMSDRRSREP
jgi:hypothetical protein